MARCDTASAVPEGFNNMTRSHHSVPLVMLKSPEWVQRLPTCMETQPSGKESKPRISLHSHHCQVLGMHQRWFQRVTRASGDADLPTLLQRWVPSAVIMTLGPGTHFGTPPRF